MPTLPRLSADTQQVHRQTCHPGSAGTWQICKQAFPCHHVAAVGYGRLTQTCVYCQMVQVCEQVCLCCYVGTWRHGIPANRQVQATVWLPPGHGSCVNRCAKVIRWWPWETGCGNRCTQAAYCVVGIRPMPPHREAGTRRVNRQVDATRYLCCIIADVQTGGPGDGTCVNRCGGATTWQHQRTAGM